MTVDNIIVYAAKSICTVSEDGTNVSVRYSPTQQFVYSAASFTAPTGSAATIAAAIAAMITSGGGSELPPQSGNANKVLMTNGTIVSWTYVLEDSLGRPSVNFETRALSSTNVTTVDYQSLFLFDGLGNKFMDWGNGYIYYNDGTTVAIQIPGSTLISSDGKNSLDWDQRTLFHSSNNSVFDWENGILSDTPSGNTCIDWYNRFLGDSNDGSSVFSWKGTLKIGFFGVTEVVKQTGGVATAGGTYNATAQGMINAMYTAMRNYGLLT